MLASSQAQLCFQFSWPPSVGEGQDEPLLLLGRQGTAREVTHPRSPRGTRAGPGEEQGFGALPTWPIQLPLPETWLLLPAQ